MNTILEHQLADQRDAAVKKVTELESRIRDLEQQITDWANDHGKLNDDLDDAASAYDEQQATIRRLEEMYQDSQQTIKNQREHIAQLERRIVEVGAECINKSYKLIDLEKENAEYRRENDHKLSAMMRLREELADIKKLHADKQTEAMELTFSHRKLLKDYAILQDYYDRECAMNER